MKIKIEITGVVPEDYRKATYVQRNKFEEISLFLDCRIIQKLIKDFRKRLGLKKTIPYEQFDSWKVRGIRKDELSSKERAFLASMDADIDYLTNKPSELDSGQKVELNQKEKERLRWLDPYYTFSEALKQKLKLRKAERFLPILIRAIVCGEIRNKDFPDSQVTRKNSRSATIIERELYWSYKTIHVVKGIRMGYGLAGLQKSIQPQSARSDINSYINKLRRYNSTLKTS